MDRKPATFPLWMIGIWLILLLTIGQAGAEEEPPFSHGLLFRVERPGAPASYLFGTIHSEDPRVLSLPGAVQEAFDGAETLALELDLGPATMLASMSGMLLQDGRVLNDVLGDRLYEQTLRAIVERGMPEVAIQKFKPWGIVMLLSMPPARTGRFLDLTLYQSAMVQGKAVRGLETVAEQLAVFDTLPEIRQIEMLRDTLENRHRFKQMFEELLDAYLKRQLGTLQQLGRQYGPTDAEMAKELEARLVHQRNQRMVRRMQPLLRQGNSFIAIGALHLPGAKGVLYLLQQQGYRITVRY